MSEQRYWVVRGHAVLHPDKDDLYLCPKGETNADDLFAPCFRGVPRLYTDPDLPQVLMRRLGKKTVRECGLRLIEIKLVDVD